MRGIHIIRAMMPNRSPEAINGTLQDFARTLLDPTWRDIYDTMVKEEIDAQLIERVRAVDTHVRK